MPCSGAHTTHAFLSNAAAAAAWQVLATPLHPTATLRVGPLPLQRPRHPQPLLSTPAAPRARASLRLQTHAAAATMQTSAAC